MSKRRQRRSDSVIRIENQRKEANMRYEQGNCYVKAGNLENALVSYNQALDLNPDEKHSLVARSQCYILLGQPKKALEDAEAALAIDKTFMKAIYQKAESLYYLGDFEHSLMYHYRGLRLRPEHNGFKLGVHKSQKAIENAIGTRNNSQPTLKPIASSSSAKVNSNSNTPNKASRATTATSKPKTVYKFACDKNKLLRELRVDKEYLDNLLVNPNLRCKSKDNDDKLKTYIQDAVDFLNARQEFWRQQLPLVQK